MQISPNYNERSWAIDLIGYLKQLSSDTNRSIKDAGGEQTIQTEGGSLFPVVLAWVPIENLTTACKSCNQTKKDMYLEDFLKLKSTQ